MSEPEARDFRLDDPEANLKMVSTSSVLQYLPELLYYPIRGYGLMVTLSFGVLWWIVGFAGAWGIPAAGIVFGWMSYYFMEVVLQSATGHAIPPPMGTEVLFQGDKLRLLMLVGYLGAVALVALVALSANHAGQKGVAIAAVCAGFYLLPAFIASLALQPEAYLALNPVTLFKFIWHTGLAYVFAALILSVVGFLGIALAGRLSALTSDILLIYGLIFVSHLVGFVSYHHHEELNLAVSVAKPTEESQAREAQTVRLQALLARMDECLAAKNPVAARDAMLAEKGDGLLSPRLFHEELFEALQQRHQDALMLVQGTRLIAHLAAEKRLPRALDILQQCLDVSKDFLPQPAALLVPLAEEALRAQKFPLFEKLVALALRRLPDSGESVSLQFLKARWLAEQRKDAEALALVAPLAARADHPWAPRIRALHQALSGLTGRR